MEETVSNADSPASRRPRRWIRFLAWDAAIFLAIGIGIALLLPTEEEPRGDEPDAGPSAAVDPRPSMKPGKPKVQRFSQPQPSERILARIETRTMPDLRLPELTSAGSGLLSGNGLPAASADLVEDARHTLFGNTASIGNELRATFYCLDQDRNERPLNLSHQEFFARLREFVISDWDESRLDRFYRSPRTLYATTVAIPLQSSLAGPIAFGEDLDKARYWAVHYRGKIVHDEGITFRFWGSSEFVLTVAVDKELVLSANYPGNSVDAYTVGENWNRRAWNSRSMLRNNGPYKVGSNSLVGGQWITLNPGVLYDIDILVSNGPSSEFFAMLMVEQRYESYSLNDWGGPILPLFALSPLSTELKNEILMNLFQGEANVTEIETYFNAF